MQKKPAPRKTNKNRLYLVDQFITRSEEEKITGLQVIEQLKISSQSTLVTSEFDHLEIQQTALRLQMKILPKSLIWSSKVFMRKPRI